MDVLVVKNGNEVVVKTSGVIDTVTSPELEKELLPVCAENEFVVLDLEGSDYMSSAGLRVVLAAAKAMHGKKFVIRHVCDTIYDVFVSTGFINILNVEE